jgi:hypothetical protein
MYHMLWLECDVERVERKGRRSAKGKICKIFGNCVPSLKKVSVFTVV